MKAKKVIKAVKEIKEKKEHVAVQKPKTKSVCKGKSCAALGLNQCPTLGLNQYPKCIQEMKSVYSKIKCRGMEASQE